MNKSVICIPSYGLRFTNLFDELHNINSYDVKIFVSDDDKHLTEYDNLNFDIIHTNAKNIMEKRSFIIEWTKQQSYDYAFIIEDDVMPHGDKITPETKRETSNSYRRIKTTLQEMLDVMLKRMIDNEASFAGFIRHEYLGFSVPNKTSINRSLNCGQFVCYNVNDIRKADIHIYVGELIPEDVKFCLDILTKGMNCICIRDYTYYEHPTEHNSVVHSDIADRSFAHIRLSRMYNFPMKITKDNVIRPRMDWKKYYNVGDKYPEYNKKVKPLYDHLYEMYDNKCSYEEIIKYLKEVILNKND